MKIKVKIKKIGSIEHGTRRDGSGTWSARSIILEEEGSLYPDTFVVRVSGEKAETLQWKVGDNALATLDFSVRENNEKMYQDVFLKNLEAA